MKIAVNISRILVGVLFIFSGMVKAIDPLGLGYKMQEFFEAWAASGFLPQLMNSLHAQATTFSICMIAVEVVIGVALLVGWKKNIILILLLLLTIFFTFLTGYVLFSGKIRACGCFGDCIPLTPIQTFTKDITLLVLIVFIIIGRKYVQPIFTNILDGVIVLISFAVVLIVQFYVLKHLPLKDCLPFKKGNDILELRKMPEGAIPDEFSYVFVYEKDGSKKEFTTENLPDSSWNFVERIQKLVKEGKNNVPLINDFSLVDADGLNVTDSLLSQPRIYYLFFLQNMRDNTAKWTTAFSELSKRASEEQQPIYIVTSDPDNVNHFFNELNQYNIPVFASDATAIKTAARATPTLFAMKGPVVQEKYSWADIGKAIHK